jgi:hypothetical protein
MEFKKKKPDAIFKTCPKNRNLMVITIHGVSTLEEVVTRIETMFSLALH